MNKKEQAIAGDFRKEFAGLIERNSVTDVIVAGDYIFVIFVDCAYLHSAHCARQGQVFDEEGFPFRYAGLTVKFETSVPRMHTVTGDLWESIVDSAKGIDALACLLGVVLAATSIVWVPLLLCIRQVDGMTVASLMGPLLVWYVVLVAKRKSWDQKLNKLEEVAYKIQDFVVPASCRVFGYPAAACVVVLLVCLLPFALLADTLRGWVPFR